MSQQFPRFASILAVCLAPILTASARERREPREVQQPPRYLAVFADGDRTEGNSLKVPAGSDKPLTLDGKNLDDPNKPLRWLRDRQLPELQQTENSQGLIEFYGGDQIPGRVVGFQPEKSAGGRYEPPKMIVETAVPLTPAKFDAPQQLRVNATHVRRVLWGRDRRHNSKPGTLTRSDGSRIVFRSARLEPDGLSVLGDDTLQHVSFDDLADVHFLEEGPWRNHVRQLAVLCPNADARLVKLETTDGLVVTASKNWLYTTNLRVGGRAATYYAIQPAWSERPLLIDPAKVRTRWEFAPHELPLTRLRPTAIEQQSAFGGSLQWQLDRNVLGGDLRCANHAFGWGLGVHATTRMGFELPACASAFRCAAGLDEIAGHRGCARVSVLLLDSKSGRVTSLYRSEHLIGSSKFIDVSPIALPVDGREDCRLVLQADSAANDRPIGADPFDVRDHVDWLEPMIELDHARLKQELRRHPDELVPAWRGWQLASTGDDCPVTIRWDDSDADAPRFVADVAAGANPIVLSQHRTIGNDDRWLRLQLANTGSESERGIIEIRIDAQPIVRLEIAQQGEERPLLIPLAPWQGKDVELEVRYLPANAEEKIAWRSLGFTDRRTEVDWRPLQIVSATSQRGTKLTIKGGGTISADGNGIDVETFEITVKSELPRITAIRLEALTDGSLLNGGPGAKAGGNFRVSQFRVSRPVPQHGKFTGRFVRVELPGPRRTLNLAEVEVWAGETNIARQGRATQSTTASDGAADRAIDGDSNGYFSSGSCTQTRPDQTDAWWELDLMDERTFDEIVIWNRTDNGCVHRLIDFNVVVLDAQRQVTWQRNQIADPPAPKLTLAATDAVDIPISTAAASFSQQGCTPTSSLDGLPRGWSIGPRTGQPHAAVFFPEQAIDDIEKGLVIRLKNSQFSYGLPARIRLLATADALPLEAEPIPAVVRTYRDGSTPPAVSSQVLATPYCLFDELGTFSPLEKDEQATASVVTSDHFRGQRAVKITPGGQFRLPLDQIVRIRKNPAEGEFRYLRFAFRKFGAGRVSLELEQPIVAPRIVRYDAGHGDLCYGPAKTIWQPGLPSEWIGSEHDLFSEWGSFDISALVIGTPDGDYGLFDYVYLARQRNDFHSLPDTPTLADANFRARRALASPVIEKASPSVVTVLVEGRRGLGVVVGDDGLVITAGHLLMGPDRDAIVYCDDGRELKAKTLPLASDVDLGALQIDTEADLPSGVEVSDAKDTPPHWLYVGFAPLENAADATRYQTYITDISDQDTKEFVTTFSTATALDGSPLFDKDARLIGIQTGRDKSGAARFTRVYDVAELRKRIWAIEVKP